MIVKDMRWGCNNERLVSYSTFDEDMYLVEILVTDNDGKNYWFLMTKLEDEEAIYISKMPMYDIMLHASDSDVDYDYEVEKMKQYVEEMYTYELPEVPDALYESKFSKVIRLLRVAMFECTEIDYHDYDTAQNFIDEYAGRKLETTGLKFYYLEGDENRMNGRNHE